MNLQIGNLYKTKHSRRLNQQPEPIGKIIERYIEQDVLVLLIDFYLEPRTSVHFSKFKVLAENGDIGWILSLLNPEDLFIEESE